MITIKLWMIVVLTIYLLWLYFTIKQWKNLNLRYPKMEQIIIPASYLGIHCVALFFGIVFGLVFAIKWLSNYKPLIDLLNYQIYP